MNSIDSFEGRYRFLSNFWMCELDYDGMIYPSSEHAYQAAKTTDITTRQKIASLSTAYDAKKAGKSVRIRPDWDEVKLDLMLQIVRAKFAVPEMASKLLGTGDAALIEGNWWGDTFWGKCGGVGENHLGQILERVRIEVRDRYSQPRRFRVLRKEKADGRYGSYVYGCYFPGTDLCVGAMGDRGTGIPNDVEWLDETWCLHLL